MFDPFGRADGLGRNGAYSVILKLARNEHICDQIVKIGPPPPRWPTRSLAHGSIFEQLQARQTLWCSCRRSPAVDAVSLEPLLQTAGADAKFVGSLIGLIARTNESNSASTELGSTSGNQSVGQVNMSTLATLDGMCHA